MKKLTLSLLAASLIFVGGCLKKGDDSKPVIKVNGQVITENMVDKALKQNASRMFRGTEIDFTNPKNKYVYLINKNVAVNTLIVDELIKYEAEKRHLKVKDDEVEESVNKFVEELGGKERFDSLLALSKLTEESFRSNVKLDLLKQKLVENLIGNKEVTEEEAKKFYAENKEKHFKHGKQVRASHILIAASPEDIEDAIKNETPDIKEDELKKQVDAKLKEAKAKAKDILARTKKDPEKFAELARQYSEDISNASKGGDLGFFPEDEMVAEFSKAAFETKPGEISNLVKTQFGYHVIKVTDRKEAGIKPYDEVSSLIKKHLDSLEKKKALLKLLETSKQEADIDYLEESYNPDNIQQELKDLQAERSKPKKPREAERAPAPETKK